MKKLVAALVTLGLVIAGLLVWNHQLMAKQSAGATGSKTLVIYNWGDYIDPSLIKKFEKQTGYKVDYETFDSNEAMLTKIQQGGTRYDLVVPSEYTVQRMQKEHLLRKLDHRQLPNLNYLAPRFLNQSFDPGNQYSVPYFWGTLGIVYNDKLVAHPLKHWEQLWDPQYRNQVMVYDSARDMMAIALITQGHSVNTTNYGELQAAERKLQGLSQNTRAVVADEMKMYLKQDEAAIGIAYSGDAAEMMDVNPHLHYVVPTEGSNIWFDNFVIPKSAKNLKGAYAFMNFMLEPKNAAQNADYVGYATPNQAARKYLPKAVTHNQAFYPDAQTMKHLEVYRDLPKKVNQEYNDLFLEFKMFVK